MRRFLTAAVAATAAFVLPACVSIASKTELPAVPAAAEVAAIEIVKEVKVTSTPNLFILYTLKEGVTPDAFDAWVRTTDQSAMRSLTRVQEFRTYRAERLMMGEGAPGTAHVEAFAIPDLEAFVAEDMGGPSVQTVMGALMGFAEAPQFIVVSEVNQVLPPSTPGLKVRASGVAGQTALFGDDTGQSGPALGKPLGQ